MGKKITGLEIYYWDNEFCNTKKDSISRKKISAELETLLGSSKSAESEDELFSFEVDDAENVVDIDDDANWKERIEITMDGVLTVETEVTQVFKSKREYCDIGDVSELLESIGEVENKLDPDFAQETDYDELGQFYKIVISYDDYSMKKMSGKMLRPDLPKNWLYIIREIETFLNDMDDLELFKTAPCSMQLSKSEVRIVRVYFGDCTENLYTYICDYDVAEGDVVLVPVGKENNFTEATVAGVEIIKRSKMNFEFDVKKVICVIDGMYDNEN